MLTSLIKGWYTLRGKPYFRVVITNNNEEGAGATFNVEFNQFFIHNLDRTYRASNAATYKPAAPDNEKVALYLFDLISGIADEYLQEDLPPGLEFEEDLPVMDLRGSGISPQVIDLGGEKGKVDFESG